MALLKSSNFVGVVMDEIEFLRKCQLQPEFELLSLHFFLDVFVGLYLKH